MITLDDFKPKIIKFLDKGLARFAKKHSKEIPTAIGLYSCPWSGWVAVCINTGDTPDQYEANCPDFKFVNFYMLDFSEWEEEYNSETPKIKVSSSKVVAPGPEEGDEGFNEPFFNLLVQIAEEYFIPGRVQAIWVGVQMLDSGLVKFWKP